VIVIVIVRFAFDYKLCVVRCVVVRCAVVVVIVVDDGKSISDVGIQLSNTIMHGTKA
jgi:hypothetical protein